MTITAQQRLAAETYLGGEFAYIADKSNWKSEMRRCGDSLFSFVMLELTDDGECRTDAVALCRMENAISMLTAVRDAFADRVNGISNGDSGHE